MLWWGNLPRYLHQTWSIELSRQILSRYLQFPFCRWNQYRKYFPLFFASPPPPVQFNILYRTLYTICCTFQTLVMVYHSTFLLYFSKIIMCSHTVSKTQPPNTLDLLICISFLEWFAKRAADFPGGWWVGQDQDPAFVPDPNQFSAAQVTWICSIIWSGTDPSSLTGVTTALPGIRGKVSHCFMMA